MGFPADDVVVKEVNEILILKLLVDATEAISEVKNAFLMEKSLLEEMKKWKINELNKKLNGSTESTLTLPPTQNKSDINRELNICYNKTEELIRANKIHEKLRDIRKIVNEVKEYEKRVRIWKDKKEPVEYLLEKICYPIWSRKKEVDEIQDEKIKKKLEEEVKYLENEALEIEKKYFEVTPEQKINTIVALMENLTTTNYAPYESISSLYKDCVEKMEFYTEEIMENIEKASEEPRKEVIRRLKPIYESLRNHVERVMDDLSAGKNQQYIVSYFELLRSEIYCAEDLKKKLENYNKKYFYPIEQVYVSLSKIKNTLPTELNDIKEMYCDLIEKIENTRKDFLKNMEKSVYEYVIISVVGRICFKIETQIQTGELSITPIFLKDIFSSYLEKLEKRGPLYLDEKEFSKYLERGRKTLERIRALESSLKETYATQT